MARTAINLYTVRDINLEFTELLEEVAAAGYDGVQFSKPYYPTAGNADEVAATIDRLDLDVTPAHLGFDVLQTDFETIATHYEQSGVSGAVIPWIDEEHFSSKSAVDEIASEVETLAEELREHGWDLYYHNHKHEYADIDGTTGFDRFIDKTTIGIELDVGWALVGGDDPVERLYQLGDRASVIHLKDTVRGEEDAYREIGEGEVDMQGCTTAALDIGADWLIYEHDHPDDPATSIRTGARVLDELLDAAENRES